jgi:hypothetical protein
LGIIFEERNALTLKPFNMKPFTFILIAALAITNLSAQEQGEMQYLFGNKEFRTSGFGAPIVEFSSFNGEFAVFNGGGGAAIFNNKFFIGGYGMGMSTQPGFPNVYSENGDLETDHLQVSFGHGGLWTGYNFMPTKPIHFVVSLKAGGGAASIINTEFDFENYEQYYDYVGVVKPQVDVEMNLLRWFKISIGAGYRYVMGINDGTYFNAEGEEIRYFNKNDFNAPYGSITFLFGGFGPKKK